MVTTSQIGQSNATKLPNEEERSTTAMEGVFVTHGTVYSLENTSKDGV